MNSYALLLWLVMANGDQQVLSARYFDNEADCLRGAGAQVEAYAREGRQVVVKCHLTHPEYTGDDIDVNGNPIPH